MQKQMLYHRRINYVFLMGMVLILIGNVLPARGAKLDLLEMPAEKSIKASKRLLMDIVKKNGRIVAVGERGLIIYSDDKGDTWIQADVPVSVSLTSVFFPTARIGWAVGHDGVVLCSMDKGQTWEKKLDGNQINHLLLAQLQQVILSKTNQLAALRNKNAVQVIALKRELEDLSYFLSDAEWAVEEGPTRPLMDVWFENDQEGLVIGSFGMILRTIDGGNSWIPLLDQMDNPEGFHYYGITQSGSDLFIVGEAGLLFRSSDFGKTWQRLISPYNGSYFGVVGKLGGGSITAFGLRGSIFSSHDRGETWFQANEKNGVSISGGTFLADGSICLISADGTLRRSVDFGKTFSILKARVPGGIAVVESDCGSLLFVGLKGVNRIKNAY